jgi:flagellin
MALGVLNNISAIYAQNNLSNTQASLSKTLQQLSSGSRINSGADDAAGLSLANGLQASSTALSQSAKNASEGVDFLQVADGALSQVTNLLNRAVTLATESSNGTLNASQTTAANSEYQKILTEINTINNTTEYNGINSFTTQSSVSVGSANDTISTAGSTGNELTLSWKDSSGATQTTTFASAGSGATSPDVTLAPGATVADLATAINNKMGSAIASIQNNQLILTGGDTLSGSLKETNAVTTSNAGTANAVSTLNGGSSTDIFVAAQINVYEGTTATATAGQTGTKDALGVTIASGDHVLTAGTSLIDVGSNSTATYAATYSGAGDATLIDAGTTAEGTAGAAGIDSYGNAIASGDKTQTLTDGRVIELGATPSANGTSTNALAVQVGNGTVAKVTVGANSTLDQVVADINKAANSSVASLQGNSIVLQGATLLGSTVEKDTSDASATNQQAVSVFTSDGTIATSYNNTATDRVKADTTALGLANSSLSTAAGAQSALTAINAAITAVAADRGTIGANINTLNSVSSVMTTQSTNTLAAMNDVTATDYGQATSDMSKYQILSQTGIAALSQANQSQQLITKLLQ